MIFIWTATAGLPMDGVSLYVDQAGSNDESRERLKRHPELKSCSTIAAALTCGGSKQESAIRSDEAVIAPHAPVKAGRCMIKQYGMQRVHDTRRPAGIKQWKRELELLRSEIGRQHDQVIERMREDETRILEAVYSFAESNHWRREVPERPARPVEELVAASLDHCFYPIGKWLRPRRAS